MWLFSSHLFARPRRRPPRTGARLAALAAAWLALLAPVADAREVRVATFNIENGTGEVGSDKYEAIWAILDRMDADIVSFQELRTTTFAAWSNLALELDYPHAVISGNGPFSGHLYNGYFSRFPILSTHNVQSPPGAVELSRFPFRAVIDVPDARRPLVLWTMHHKASAGSIDKFRRAIEAYRIVQDIDAYLTENPDHIEYVLTGDMNDDIRDSQTPVQFNSQPSGAPGSYVLGDDITFPVAYATFPTHRYATAGEGLIYMPAFWEGTANPVTRPASSRQLDYVFLSPALMDSPLGAPQAEVYHSDADLGGGLPKVGPPLLPGTSAAASDHLPIFVDIFMADFSPVLPTATFHSSGEAGGPFEPESMTYTLTETNALDSYWHAETDVDWLSADIDAFWLTPFAPVEVDVFLNATATALPPGLHAGSVSFYNETADLLEIRDVELTVRDHLDVSPADGLTAAGTLGGPYAPDSMNFVVTNKSALSISFTAAATENWITTSPSSGLLHAGQAVEVTVSINANALGLPIGAHADAVVFSNQVTGLTQTRPVSLAIAGALCEAVDACSLAWTTGGDAPWFYQTETAFDGVDAAQSGPIGTSQSTWLETVIEGPARIGFHWAVSSRSSHYLRFRINGIEQASIGGETGWTNRQVEIASGTHTVRWDFTTTTFAPQGANAGWLDQVQIHHLMASPATTWTPSGIPGGPFSPTTQTYVLTNSGPVAIDWTASPGVDWLSIDPADGTLPSGESEPIEISLNEQAAALPAGTHAGYVTFTNHTTGDSFIRTVSLTIRDYLVITPAYSWHTGFVGGPYEPESVAYALSNSGPAAVEWTATANTNWVAVEPASGTVAPGETAVVVASLTPHADTRPAGWNFATLTFSNATTSLSQSRWIYLQLQEPLAVSSPAWAPDGPVGGPFAPGSAVYTLTNQSPSAQSWTVSSSAPWLSIDPGGGTLDGSAAVPVTASLNAAADALPMGAYMATLVFSNLTTGTAITQAISLAVGVEFCEALDACDLDWTFGGNAPWVYQTTVTHDGIDAAASGLITDSQDSLMQTTVSGPGTLSFWWKVSSEGGWDFLEFWIDGVRTNNISGEVDWQMQTYELGDGPHVLRWRYMKDEVYSSGADRGWVDQVSWTSATTAMGVPIAWYQRFDLEPGEDETWNDLDSLPAASGDANWFQHAAGLDPTDPADVFQILDIHQSIGEPVRIEWWGGTNGPASPYVIESTLDLDLGPWESIGSSPRAAGLNVWSNPVPADTLRFYRIQARPGP